MASTETPTTAADVTESVPSKPKVNAPKKATTTKPKPAAKRKPAPKKATEQVDLIEKMKTELAEQIETLDSDVEEITAKFNDEIEPLRVERGNLQTALDALNGKAKGSGSGKRGRPRGTGTRAQEAIEIITKEPGLNAGEIAEKMGINQNYLYRVLPALAEDDKIEKRGRGWYVPDAA